MDKYAYASMNFFNNRIKIYFVEERSLLSQLKTRWVI